MLHVQILTFLELMWRSFAFLGLYENLFTMNIWRLLNQFIEIAL